MQSRAEDLCLARQSTSRVNSPECRLRLQDRGLVVVRDGGDRGNGNLGGTPVLHHERVKTGAVQVLRQVGENVPERAQFTAEAKAGAQQHAERQPPTVGECREL